MMVASEPAITELTTAGPANWAIGVSAETKAITAVVPPVKKTSWTSRPLRSKMPVSLASHAGKASPLMAL